MTGSSYSFRPGFKAFRRPEAIGPDVLEALRVRFEGDDRFVLYTGGAYGRRRASARSNALATVTEIREPLPILELLRRAARASGEGIGYDPTTVLGGLGLHAGAKPAVYLYLYRRGDDFFAVKDIPYPDPSFSAKPFKAGDKVFSLAPVVEAKTSEEASTKASKSKRA